MFIIIITKTESKTGTTASIVSTFFDTLFLFHLVVFSVSLGQYLLVEQMPPAPLWWWVVCHAFLWWSWWYRWDKLEHVILNILIHTHQHQLFWSGAWRSVSKLQSESQLGCRTQDYQQMNLVWWHEFVQGIFHQLYQHFWREVHRLSTYHQPSGSKW